MSPISLTETQTFGYRTAKGDNIDELVHERRNYIANALELRLSCTDPSICGFYKDFSLLAFGPAKSDNMRN